MDVAVLGTGLMGKPMAERLLQDKHTVTVFNRTRSKTISLIDKGAFLAESPTDAIERAQVILLMVTDAKSIDELLFPPNDSSTLSDKTFLQMGTISPQESLALSHKLSEKNAQYMESPVLGSIPEAESGNLILMVGSTKQQFETYRALLQCLGPAPIHVGPVGHASAVKLALNQLIGSLTYAFSLSLGYVQRQGVEVNRFMEILRQSAVYAPTFDKKVPRMLERNYSNPNFPAKHLLKDIALFRDHAASLHLDNAITHALSSILSKAKEQGLADLDYSALHEIVVPVDVMEDIRDAEAQVDKGYGCSHLSTKKNILDQL